MARSRNIYRPDDKKPFKLSRSKIELFCGCPRCFHLDRRLGIGRPSGPPFRLNIAVDELLKREFDAYREQGKPHPYMVEAGIDAVPAQHPELDSWRYNFRGVQVLHEPTNLLVFGAIDDLWIDARGRHIVVDYKATAKKGEVSLDAPWQDAYKRQAEIYQWLIRGNGLDVDPTAWFVYCNGMLDADEFGNSLKFRVKLLPHLGSDHWIDGALGEIHRVLNLSSPPPPAEGCEWCGYIADAARLSQSEGL